MDVEGEDRYFMLGNNSLFQAQNPLLQTIIHRHSNEPHTTGEKYAEKKYFFLFPSAIFFFLFLPNHRNYKQADNLDIGAYGIQECPLYFVLYTTTLQLW